MTAAIVKSVKSNTIPSVVSAVININDELVLMLLATGIADIVISFNSNGKTVEKILKAVTDKEVYHQKLIKK